MGKIWAGDDGDPLVAEANYATLAFAAGCFAPGQPLHGESLENVISRGKVWLGQLEAVQVKLGNADSMARAKDAPHDLGPAGDRPVITDALPSRGRSGLFDTSRTARYAENLQKRGAAQVASPPTADARTANGRPTLFGAARAAVCTYAASLAAGTKYRVKVAKPK